MSQDKLLELIGTDLREIQQYSEPNFIGSRGGLYLVRCYQCPGAEEGDQRDWADHGRENWAPAVAGGSCAWCGWKCDTKVLAEILKRRGSIGEEHPASRFTFTLEERERQFRFTIEKPRMPKKSSAGGLTLKEVRQRYPEQYEEALLMHKAGVPYFPEDQEDDGEID